VGHLGYSMCIDMSRLIPAGSVALLLNSAYLVAAPSASIWYYLQVGLHPLLGITLALANIFLVGVIALVVPI